VADGWAYGNDYEGQIVGKTTLVLIAHVRGEMVLVLMDRAGEDRVLEKPTDVGLNIFRAENGGLVRYEITRLAQPEVIGPLVDPDRPKQGLALQSSSAMRSTYSSASVRCSRANEWPTAMTCMPAALAERMPVGLSSITMQREGRTCRRLAASR